MLLSVRSVSTSFFWRVLLISIIESLFSFKLLELPNSCFKYDTFPVSTNYAKLYKNPLRFDLILFVSSRRRATQNIATKGTS